MSVTVFNTQNKGHETGKYPLFLGEGLGLVDTVNCAYPEIEKLYQIQVSQIWNELEISLEQDKQDMLNVPKDTADLMVKTVAWQHAADSIAARSVTGLLLPHVTNSELECLVNAWGFFESIHARSYSHIVKQTFVNPQQMLVDTYNSTETLIRSKSIIDAFDGMANMPEDAPMDEKRERIALALVALLCLEQISLMSSFAVTFAIAETGVFQGISQQVTLIARDEQIHVRAGYEILRILMQEPEWVEAFETIKPKALQVVTDVVQQELDWADYLFSEGRSVVGLTAALLKDYSTWMAKPVFRVLGIDNPFDAPETNPCPFMDKYIDSSKTQVAPQEIQITSYRINAVKDDTDDLNLDMEF